MNILVLNSGSSSQKMCLYELGEVLPEDPPDSVWQATIEWDGDLAASRVKRADGSLQESQFKVSSRVEAIKHLLGEVSGRSRVTPSRPQIVEEVLSGSNAPQQHEPAA